MDFEKQNPAASARGGAPEAVSGLAGFDGVKDSAADHASQGPLPIALGFARRGWRVLPLRPGAKAPAIAGWPDKATVDENTIKGWFEPPEGDASRNVGIFMGDGGLVLDVDVKPGPPDDATFCGDPRETAARRLAAFCAGRELPPTWAARTASGGLHYFFALPEGAATQKRIKARVGIDLIAGAAYVVAAGSTLSNGGRYAWLPVRSFDDLPLATAPDWLVAESGPPQATAPGPKKREPRVRPCMNAERAAELYRAWLANEAPEAVEGAGGRKTTKKVVMRGMDYGVTPDAIQDILFEENGWDSRKASPSWLGEADELQDLIDGLAAVRQDEIGSRYRMSGAELDAFLHDAFGAVRLENPADEGPQEKPAEDAPARKWQTADDAAESALANLSDSLVEGLLDEKSVGVLFGAPNSGKSAIALSIAEAIATGDGWGGRAVEQGPVLYVAAEGGAGIRHRFAAMKKRRGGNFDAPLYLVSAPLVLRENPKNVSELLTAAREVAAHAGAPLKLIVLDTLGDVFAGGNENDASEMTSFFQGLFKIRDALNCAILLLHHTGKDEGRGERGTTAIRAKADMTAHVAGDEIRVMKQRDGERGEPIRYTLEGVEIGRTPKGKPATGVVAKIMRADEEWRLPLTLREQWALDALWSACEGREPTEAEPIVCVSTGGWNAAMADAQDGHRDASAFRKLRLALRDKGRVRASGRAREEYWTPVSET